ncbi:MAG: polyprenyl synthetase family protein [Planctomycetota bacterium]|nr:polyprenyl synthetase family protein [Planctomycetota bacterium]
MTAPAINPLDPLPEIDAALRRLTATLGPDFGLPPSLADAVTYALLGPGKRIRPLLAWHACVAAGGEGARSLPSGVAIELVHAFSLVHDDLPALDNDDMRRGRPTLHRHTSEAMAILAGDEMLTLAFRVLLRQAGAAQLSPSLAASLADELARGTLAMIHGQVLDTLGVPDPSAPALEIVRLIHEQKTGALIRAAVRMGAMCSDSVTEDSLTHLTAAAEAMGLAFQIADDLLDVESSAEEVGKATGKDAALGKRTYPGAIGAEACRAEIQRLRAVTAQHLGALGPGAAGLAALSDQLATRTK